MASSESVLPAVLRGTDGGFTEISIKSRLLAIVDAVVEHNTKKSIEGSLEFSDDVVKALEKLKEEISSGCELPDLPSDDPWQKWVCMLKGGEGGVPGSGEGATWMSAPWFFVENYFYRRILHLVCDAEKRDVYKCEDGWWSVGMGDPFLAQKLRSLSDGGPAVVASLHPVVEALGGEVGEEEAVGLVRKLVVGCLWGNRVDLSLTGGAASAVSAVRGEEEVGEEEEEVLEERLKRSGLLVDESDVIAKELVRRVKEGEKIVVVLDNAGPELLCDLGLVCGLHALASSWGRSTEEEGGFLVELHCKPAPVFVSDVIRSDIPFHLTALGSLQDYIQTPLVIKTHELYISPIRISEKPLQDYISAAVLFKGDANFRRLVEDRWWPIDTPFTTALQGYLQASPCTTSSSSPSAKSSNTLIAVLRTCKSDALVAVPTHVAHAAAQVYGSEWRVAGKLGLILAAKF